MLLRHDCSKSIQFSKLKICSKAFSLALLPEDSTVHGVSRLTRRELEAAMFGFSIEGTPDHLVWNSGFQLH